MNNRILFLLCAANLWVVQVAAVGVSDGGSVAVQRREVTLDSLRAAAVAHYPLTGDRELIRRSEQYSLRNANRGYVPQVSVSAKATYQTDVTDLPFQVPGFNITPAPLDQYQVSVDVNQVLWDGGAIAAAKRGIRAQGQADMMELEVQLYVIRERVDNLFFGILLLDRKLAQLDLYDSVLMRNYRRVSSLMASGMAYTSDLDAVRVEQLTSGQNRADLVTTRGAYVRMLGQMVGDGDFEAKGVVLCVPQMPSNLGDSISDSRPEYRLFEAQQDGLDAQRRKLAAGNNPTFGLFVKGAYGDPGLNMLKGGFKPYAIAGAQFSWNIGSFYTFSAEVQKLKLQSARIASQRAAFEYNTGLDIKQVNGELNKYRRQLEDDERIVELRAAIGRAAEVRVERGAITVADMLDELARERDARLNMEVHQVQMLMSAYKITNLTNN